MKKKLVVLTGAGISAESGIKTFRDSDGLWEGHNVMDVATPEGWRKNPVLVLDFYNQRRQQLKEVQPNLAHQILAELDDDQSGGIDFAEFLRLATAKLSDKESRVEVDKVFQSFDINRAVKILLNIG